MSFRDASNTRIARIARLAWAGGPGPRRPGPRTIGAAPGPAPWRRDRGGAPKARPFRASLRERWDLAHGWRRGLWRRSQGYVGETETPGCPQPDRDGHQLPARPDAGRQHPDRGRHRAETLRQGARYLRLRTGSRDS